MRGSRKERKEEKRKSAKKRFLNQTIPTIDSHINYSFYFFVGYSLPIYQTERQLTSSEVRAHLCHTRDCQDSDKIDGESFREDTAGKFVKNLDFTPRRCYISRREFCETDIIFEKEKQMAGLLLLFANDNPLAIAAGVIIIILILGITAWYFQTKSKRDEAAYKSAADSNGWNYQKEQELAKLGSSGVIRHRFTPKAENDMSDWSLVIEYFTNADGRSRNTTWQTDSIKLENDLFLIGPRPSDFPQSLDFGDSLTEMAMQFLLRAAFGNDAPDTSRLREMKNINSDFGKHYMVFATNESISNSILTTQTESLLIELAKMLKEKQRPAVFFWRRGLQIKCNDNISNADALGKIVMLGDNLLDVRRTDKKVI